MKVNKKRDNTTVNLIDFFFYFTFIILISYELCIIKFYFRENFLSLYL